MSMLRKDLLILRRSRLLVALLVVYPVAIALLIGLAISRSPSKPRVAIVDETPPGQVVRVGNERVNVSQYAQQVFGQVHAVKVASRAQAIDKVKSGDVLAAVVIPPDIAAKLTTGLRQGQLEVIYNGDALEQSLVQSEISSALAQANLRFSEGIQVAAVKVLDLLLKGAFARTRRERLHYSFAGRVFNQKSLVRIHHSQNSVSLVGGHVIPSLYAKFYYVGYPTDHLRRSAQSGQEVFYKSCHQSQ